MKNAESSFLIYWKAIGLLKSILRDQAAATCLHLLSTEQPREHIKYSALLDHLSIKHAQPQKSMSTPEVT